MTGVNGMAMYEQGKEMSPSGIKMPADGFRAREPKYRKPGSPRK
jgi:hypothetical protein